MLSTILGVLVIFACAAVLAIGMNNCFKDSYKDEN